MSIKAQRILQATVFNLFCFWGGCFYTIDAHSAVKNYISYELEYKTFNEMRVRLEKTLGIPLKNRGEAHITVITPPEYEKLLLKLKPQQIHAVANETLMRKPGYKIICVGSGSVKFEGQTESTYYAVVVANELTEIRKTLARLSGLTKEQFDPNLFYPHVTLGFTLRDLHYEEGVIKDKNSCLK